MIILPKCIQAITGTNTYELDSIGMSGSSILKFSNSVLKIEKESMESNHEYEIMKYLKNKLPVPDILCHTKENGNNYLLMSKADGQMLCDNFYLENPDKLTNILADALHMLWNLDISDINNYSYNMGINKKLEMAAYNMEHNLVDIDNTEPETFGENGFSNPEALLDWLIQNKPKEDLVFSHGDFCLPNIFANNGEINCFIDLGKAGIADRYQDIALCYRSLCHNFDGAYGGKIYPSFQPIILFQKLGITPDWDKVHYYILLDELF